MKRLMVDCNFNWFGPWQPTVIPFGVIYYGLEEGEHVIAYQEGEEWEGIVRFDSSAPENHQWFVELLPGPGRSISQERAEGRAEGTYMGEASGAMRWAQRVAAEMLRDGWDVDLIARYTGLSKDRILARRSTPGT